MIRLHKYFHMSRSNIVAVLLRQRDESKPVVEDAAILLKTADSTTPVRIELAQIDEGSTIEQHFSDIIEQINHVDSGHGMSN